MGIERVLFSSRAIGLAPALRRLFGPEEGLRLQAGLRAVLQKEIEEFHRLISPAPRAASFTYGDYLKIPELLRLQEPLSGPNPHEWLFIEVHQICELGLRGSCQSVERAIQALNTDLLQESSFFLRRAAMGIRALFLHIDRLADMGPEGFETFRPLLGTASGKQSGQFRELEFLIGLKDGAIVSQFQAEGLVDEARILAKRLDEDDLVMAFSSFLSRRYPDLRPQQVLRKLYGGRLQNLDLRRLADRLVELDEALLELRRHHMELVRQMIGDKPGTGGSPGVSYLRGTLVKRAFPLLAQLRGRSV